MEDLGQKLYALQSIIMSLEARVSKIDAQVEMLDDDIGEADTPVGWGGEGDSEGDYAFKLSATENMDGNGDPYDPPKFTVTVLGGTAQTFGGSPHLYEDTEIPDADDGDYICVNYQNVDSNYIEVGEWDADIHAWNASTIANHSAPQELVFVLGRVGEAYSSNVRQDHKGGIVMPAISNVVDIQTQLP